MVEYWWNPCKSHSYSTKDVHKTDVCNIVFYNAVTQKQIAEISESGVIINFSFLLLDMQFITVFNERYTAITMQVIFVTFLENHNGMIPLICRIITTKNICNANLSTNTILSFFGKILYCPPIVNSPNGNPHIKRIR